MPHDRMLATRHTWTWINKYIFPGGFLPSVQAIDEITRADTTLRLVRPALLRQHYAETLRALGRRVPGRARAGPGPRLRRDLRADVALLPGVLARRLRVGLHRRAAADLRTGSPDDHHRAAPGSRPASHRAWRPRLEAALRPFVGRRPAGAAARLGRLRGRPGRCAAGRAALAGRRTPAAVAPGRARRRPGLRHRRDRGAPRPRRRADPRLVRRRASAASRGVRPSPAAFARALRAAVGVGAVGRPRGFPPRRRGSAGGCTASSATGARSATTTTCPTSSTRCSSTRRWRTPRATGAPTTRRTRWRTRSATSSTWSAARSASRPGCASSTSAAAGARCRCTPPSTTAPGSPA